MTAATIEQQRADQQVDSPWLTPEQAAAYVGCRTIKAFNTWTERRGVPPDGKRGRLRLFTKLTLDRVLRNDVRPKWRRC